MKSIIHIYRNNLYGRDTLLQTALFCQRLHDVDLHVYIPRQKQFLMYFENDVVTIDLDSSYLESPKTAKKNVKAILKNTDVEYHLFEPQDFTASTLPNLPVHYDFMTCPRSIVESYAVKPFGYLGTKVRQIVKNARFPIFISTPVYKEWNRIVCFFGGSKLGLRAVELAYQVSRQSGLPLSIFTQVENGYQEKYKSVLKKCSFWEKIESGLIVWNIFEKGSLKENLSQIPYDALAVLGAIGHRNMKELVFGSKLEIIQECLPNPMLVIGPNY